MLAYFVKKSEIAREKANQFILKLWSLQEFPLEKIAFLVDASTEYVIEVILEFLQKEGLSALEASLKIAHFKTHFS